MTNICADGRMMNARNIFKLRKSRMYRKRRKLHLWKMCKMYIVAVQHNLYLQKALHKANFHRLDTLHGFCPPSSASRYFILNNLNYNVNAGY